MKKLSPVLAMYKAEDFEDALSKAEHLIADGGFGHTSSLYINVETQADKIAEFSERMKTCRCLINTPSSHGGIGDLYNFDFCSFPHTRLCSWAATQFLRTLALSTC